MRGDGEVRETDGRAGVVAPEASYLICATPRSGSTMLCDALEGTEIAGRPAEHFEVLLETGQPRQPRDYFQRSNDPEVDRKSTRLNSSHANISYAVFCLKKKKNNQISYPLT